MKFLVNWVFLFSAILVCYGVNSDCSCNVVIVSSLVFATRNLFEMSHSLI